MLEIAPLACIKEWDFTWPDSPFGFVSTMSLCVQVHIYRFAFGIQHPGYYFSDHSLISLSRLITHPHSRSVVDISVKVMLSDPFQVSL